MIILIWVLFSFITVYLLIKTNMWINEINFNELLFGFTIIMSGPLGLIAFMIYYIDNFSDKILKR